jgi:uncharacterized coiled-coil DUF342 family protein
MKNLIERLEALPWHDPTINEAITALREQENLIATCRTNDILIEQLQARIEELDKTAQGYYNEAADAFAKVKQYEQALQDIYDETDDMAARALARSLLPDQGE